MVTVETATVADVDAVADRWVELAEGQRRFGSHLLAATNRGAVRDAFVRRAVVDELLVVRDDASGEQRPASGSGPCDDCEIIGFVTFSTESGHFEQDTTRGIVRNIYVVPARRGEGIGSALLEAAESALADMGVETVALEVMADNDAARRFYRRHGYAPHRVELEKSVESDTLTKE